MLYKNHVNLNKGNKNNYQKFQSLPADDVKSWNNDAWETTLVEINEEIKERSKFLQSHFHRTEFDLTGIISSKSLEQLRPPLCLSPAVNVSLEANITLFLAQKQFCLDKAITDVCRQKHHFIIPNLKAVRVVAVNCY